MLEIAEAYKEYLSRHHPPKYESFIKLEGNDAVAARAEAGIFNILIEHKLNPSVYEHPSGGGPDFSAGNEHGRFLAEITSIKAEAVTEKSNWKNNFEWGGKFWDDYSPAEADS